jgi:hypothetical protein
MMVLADVVLWSLGFVVAVLLFLVLLGLGFIDFLLAIVAFGRWLLGTPGREHAPGIYDGKLKLCPKGHQNSPSAQYCWICGEPMGQ